MFNPLGARLYDKGYQERCYQLYRSGAEELVKQAKANGQTASWINIFEKAFQYCGQPQAKNWGTQSDGAWIMRRAFEAIKEVKIGEENWFLMTRLLMLTENTTMKIS